MGIPTYGGSMAADLAICSLESFYGVAKGTLLSYPAELLMNMTRGLMHMSQQQSYAMP